MNIQYRNYKRYPIEVKRIDADCRSARSHRLTGINGDPRCRWNAPRIK